MEQAFLVDIASSFKLLIVLTSALFAIAQYYENNQRKIIENEQHITRDIDLSQQHATTLRNSVKDIYDSIMNVKPINNQRTIFCLLLLICLLIFLFVLALCSDWFSINVQAVRLALKLYSVVTLFFGAWLLVNWLRMQRQMKNFKASVNTFKTLCATFAKFLENNKSHQ